MGLFGGRDESKWSAACEELTTDIDIVLDNIQGALSDIKSAVNAAKNLKKYDGQDKDVLENLAYRLTSATGLEVDELLRNAQAAGTSASNLSRIINSF